MANNSSPEEIKKMGNLIHLRHLHEPSILHHVHKRYDDDIIYTFTGDILLSVNPFKSLNIYDNTIIKGFHSGDLNYPHIFSISKNAYAASFKNDNQSILISGESGAGKTVAAKYIMRYLTLVGSNEQKRVENSIENKILCSNPILEAFGNSKTLRNDNSSRFGKFIKLFQEDGKIIGSKIETYLLEQIRIVCPSIYERNYHIFYMILKGLDKETLDKYYYRNIKDYRYLDTNCYERSDGVDDVDEFIIWKKSMGLMGFTDREINDIYALLSVILLFGQLTIDDTDVDNILIQDETTLREISILLGLGTDVGFLVNKLKYRTMKTQNEQYTIKLNKHEVENTINTIAKTIYNYLFDWIVNKINRTLYCENQNLFIGILDIFGFEVFKNNSFEQLCINFTNEVLQEQFNYFIFKREQELYKEEGITWDLINYPDNKEIINLFLKKPNGIFYILNDYCQLNKNYRYFYSKMINSHENNNSLFFDSKMKPYYKFIIKHYATDVCYSSENFCSKNKHNIHVDVFELFDTITIPLWKNIINVVGGMNSDKRQSINQDTICNKFRTQLLNLMNAIKKTKPHYIRCLKPNDLNIKNKFNNLRVLEQLKYAGVLEAIKIARLGYPIRLYTRDYIVRYKSLFSDGVDISFLKNDDIQQGKTKVFLKKTAYDKLEKYRYQCLNKFCTKIQAFYRVYRQKCLYKIIKNSILLIQCFKRCMDSKKLFRQLLLHSKAIKIQTIYRGFKNHKLYKLFLKKVIIVQSMMRKTVQLNKYTFIRKTKVSISLATLFRKFSCRKRYKNYKNTIIVLQSHMRRKLAKPVYREKRREARDIQLLQTQVANYKKIVLQLKEQLGKRDDVIYKYSKQLSSYIKDKKYCSTQTEDVVKKEAQTQTKSTEKKVTFGFIKKFLAHNPNPRPYPRSKSQPRKKIVKDSSNKIIEKTDIRLHKNRIENNYLLIEDGMRDKLIKKLKNEHINSINSANKLIENKNKLIDKLNKLLDNYKYKINSLEEASIDESKIKRSLIKRIIKLESREQLQSHIFQI